MKPLKSSNKLVSSVNNTTSFKMETSAETFEIFSSQIYEHKIRAIIRELSCNAHDSHKDANKGDVPFRIHFPTMFEPWFEVEDFGVGLDDYDVRGKEIVLYDEDGNEASRYMEGGIYTTYFASSKRESNDTIGHLGLGSKSPMAYTKSMTVVARKDGVERHYVCFIGENGQPQTTFNSEKPTEEGNGVKVRFSVAMSDFEEFKREAGFVLSLFTVKPETNVEIEPLLTDSEFETLKDEGVLMLSQGHSFHSHEPAAVYANMGGVVYPVRNLDWYYMDGTILVNEDEYNTGEAEEAEYYTFDKATVSFIKSTIERSNRRLIMNFPIGDLSFMPSREGLSQDTKTKFNFYKGLVEHFYKTVAELKAKIQNSRSALEAINVFGQFSSPTDMFAFDYTYDGKSVAAFTHEKPFKGLFDVLDDEIGKNCIKIHRKAYTYESFHHSSNDKTTIKQPSIFSLTYYHLYEYMDNQSSFDCFYANEKDEMKGTAKAIRFYQDQGEPDDGNKIIVIHNPDANEEAFKALDHVFYGNVNYRHISELVEAVKVIDPQFFVRKKNGKIIKSTRASKKNEAKVEMMTIDKRTGRLKTSNNKVLVDLSKLNPKTTAWIAKRPATDYNVANAPYDIAVNDMTYRMGANNALNGYMNHFGITTIVISDGINRARVKKSGLPSIDSILDDFVVSNKDAMIEWQSFKVIDSAYLEGTDKEKFSNLLNSVSLRYSSKRTFTYLYENDPDFTKPWVDNVLIEIDEYVNKHRPKSTLDIHKTFYKFLSNEDLQLVEAASDNYEAFMADQRDSMEQITKQIKNRYPLLFDVDDNQDAVLEYVGLVNDKQRSQMKVA